MARLVRARVRRALLEAAEVVAVQKVDRTLLAHDDEDVGNGGRAERVWQREWRAGSDVLVGVAEVLRVARSPKVIRLQGASGLDVEADRGFTQPG
jgi:hypothetical protein